MRFMHWSNSPKVAPKPATVTLQEFATEHRAREMEYAQSLRARPARLPAFLDETSIGSARSSHSYQVLHRFREPIECCLQCRHGESPRRAQLRLPRAH